MSGHLRIVLNGVPVPAMPSWEDRSALDGPASVAQSDWRDSPRRTPREASRKEQDETRLRKLLRIDDTNRQGMLLEELLDAAITEIRDYQFEQNLGSDQWRLFGMIREQLEMALALEHLRVSRVGALS